MVEFTTLSQVRYHIGFLLEESVVVHIILRDHITLSIPTTYLRVHLTPRLTSAHSESTREARTLPLNFTWCDLILASVQIPHRVKGSRADRPLTTYNTTGA